MFKTYIKRSIYAFNVRFIRYMWFKALNFYCLAGLIVAFIGIHLYSDGALSSIFFSSMQNTDKLQGNYVDPTLCHVHSELILENLLWYRTLGPHGFCNRIIYDPKQRTPSNLHCTTTDLRPFVW